MIYNDKYQIRLSSQIDPAFIIASMFHAVGELYQSTEIIHAQLHPLQNLLLILYRSEIRLYNLYNFSLSKKIPLLFQVDRAAQIKNKSKDPSLLLVVNSLRLLLARIDQNLDLVILAQEKRSKKIENRNQIVLNVCATFQQILFYKGKQLVLIHYQQEPPYFKGVYDIQLTFQKLYLTKALNHNHSPFIFVSLTDQNSCLQIVNIHKADKVRIQKQILISKAVVHAISETEQNIIVGITGQIHIYKHSLQEISRVTISTDIRPKSFLRLNNTFILVGSHLLLFDWTSSKVIGEQSYSQALHLGNLKLLFFGGNQSPQIVQLKESLQGDTVKVLLKLDSSGPIYQICPVSNGDQKKIFVNTPFKSKRLSYFTNCYSYAKEAQLPLKDRCLGLALGPNNQTFIASFTDYSYLIQYSSQFKIVKKINFQVLFVNQQVLVSTQGVSRIQDPDELIYKGRIFQAQGNARRLVLLENQSIRLTSTDCRTTFQCLKTDMTVSFHLSVNKLYVLNFCSSVVTIYDFNSQTSYTIDLEAQSNPVSAQQINEQETAFGLFNGAVLIVNPYSKRYLVGGFGPVQLRLYKGSLICISQNGILLRKGTYSINEKMQDCIQFKGKLIISSENNIKLGTVSQYHERKLIGTQFNIDQWDFVKSHQSILFCFGKQTLKIFDPFKNQITTHKSLLNNTVAVDILNMNYVAAGQDSRGFGIIQLSVKGKSMVINYRGNVLHCGWLQNDLIVVLTQQRWILYRINWVANDLQLNQEFAWGMKVKAVQAVAFQKEKKLMAVHDIFNCLSVFRIQLKQKIFYPIAFSTLPVGLCRLAYLGSKLIVADERGILMIYDLNLNVTNDLQRIHLRLQGIMQLREQITCMQQADNNNLIFGTVSGSVGYIKQLNAQTYNQIRKTNQKKQIKGFSKLISLKQSRREEGIINAVFLKKNEDQLGFDLINFK